MIVFLPLLSHHSSIHLSLDFVRKLESFQKTIKSFHLFDQTIFSTFSMRTDNVFDFENKSRTRVWKARFILLFFFLSLWHDVYNVYVCISTITESKYSFQKDHIRLHNFYRYDFPKYNHPIQKIYININNPRYLVVKIANAT